MTIVYEGKWIFIEELWTPKDKKTREFEVANTMEGCEFGIVKWKASWRKYAFFPYAQTCFEWICMRDIATFCEQETKRYKENWVKK
jgi:hypothetical protein